VEDRCLLIRGKGCKVGVCVCWGHMATRPLRPHTIVAYVACRQAQDDSCCLPARHTRQLLCHILLVERRVSSPYAMHTREAEPLAYYVALLRRDRWFAEYTRCC